MVSFQDDSLNPLSQKSVMASEALLAAELRPTTSCGLLAKRETRTEAVGSLALEAAVLFDVPIVWIFTSSFMISMLPCNRDRE
jgi:hypothetical protein